MMSDRRKIHDQKGFTLVELMVALSLLLLVLGLGYTIFGFTVTTFARSETKANLQQNMRLAAQYIENDVRYAYGVEILDAIDPDSLTVTENDMYIYINSDGKLEIRSADDTFILSDTFIGDTDFLLQFTKEGDNLLGIDVGNTADEKKIITRIKVLNISEDDGMITGVETGSAIRITVL